MLHVKRYLASLAVVLTAMAAYALGVAPWIEPPPIVRQVNANSLPNVEATDPTRELIDRIFSPEAWERRDNPKIVETEACTLLVKDYKPTPDGKLELTPCTLIFYATAAGSKERRPIVLQAPGGASIQFDKALDIAKAQFGKLVGGELPGEITIFSPPTSPEANDGLHLTTRNIIIEKSRVYTTHAVDFRYGESHGRGQDLSIALLPKDPEDPNSGIGGIRSITLEKIDRLHIETAGGDPFASQRKQQNSPPAPLEVTCQGSFVFDVLNETAMFERAVEVQRVNAEGPPDKLTCDRLLLVFAEEANLQEGKTKLQRSTPAASLPADPLAGRIQRIVAEGRPVRLVAPSSATVASAARIEYSLAKRRLLLVPGPEAEQVSLKQQDNVFAARELEYEMAEAGRLGRLWAAGPGELTFTQLAGPLRQTIVAHWDKELRIQPHERNQVISLVENASIDVDPLGQFSAEELHFWVLEVEEKKPGAESQEPGTREQNRVTILPDRLLASGGVELNSPRLHVDTSRLEIWFQNLPAKPQPLPPLGQAPIAPAAHQQAVGVSPSRPDAKSIRPPSLQKFDLSGDLIQMQIVRQGAESELEDLTIRGHVILDETRTEEPGQKPIRIRGDMLELRGGVTGPGKIDIAGQPAEVGGRGMSLAGNEIHMLQRENRLWIDGPGEAKLPAALNVGLPGLGGESGAGSREWRVDGAAGRAAKPPGEVHVVWQDRFHFDGQTSEMFGEVQASTATQVVSAKRLEATLNRRIDFAAMQNRGDTDLARLTFDGGVDITNRTLDEHDEQVSYDQMQVKNLVFDRTAGTLHADGPGWVRSTRVASASLPGGAALPMPMPAGPVDPSAPPKLNQIQITFQGPIEGLLDKRQIEFHRDVRTTFVPVKDWDERIEVKQLEDLGERGILMTCEKLTVIEMRPAGRKPWIEAFVTGNAIVEGQTFTVHAPRISYTSDKQLLTLEGDGRADAVLWHRTAPGQPGSRVPAQKWQYWIETGEFSVEGIGNSDFQAPPGGLRLRGRQ
jgi:lipopolysaccharide export system protein LptA